MKHIKVVAVARDAKGRLLVTGDENDFQPALIPPGGLSFGSVGLFFRGKKFSPGSTIELEASIVKDFSSPWQPVDLPIKNLRYVNGQVVGIGKNTSGKKLDGGATGSSSDSTLTQPSAMRPGG